MGFHLMPVPFTFLHKLRPSVHLFSMKVHKAKPNLLLTEHIHKNEL